MRTKLPNKLAVVSFILVLFFFFFNKKDKVIVNQLDEKLIENFDLILTKGQSVESKLVNLLNLSMKRNYSHIGIVYKQKDKIFILHSTPDGTKDNCIRFDDIQSFIDLSTVCDYIILRHKNNTDKNQELLKIELEKYKTSKIPFDYEFDNKDHHYIYCSELVYLIFTKVGLFSITSFNLNNPIYPNLFLYQKNLIFITERKSITNKRFTTGESVQ